MTQVTFQTNMGDIIIEVDHENAPIGAENFVHYAMDGFYNGTIFHRIIPGFMVQGGGMLPGMEEKPSGEPIENEADNGLKNVRGSLSYARTMDPHSATTQFFGILLPKIRVRCGVRSRFRTAALRTTTVRL